jgi:hypothetical protein
VLISCRVGAVIGSVVVNLIEVLKAKNLTSFVLFQNIQLFDGCADFIPFIVCFAWIIQ